MVHRSRVQIIVCGAVVSITACLTLRGVDKTEETTVRNLKITKEPPTTARANVVQPGANKIPAKPMIPIPTIPMERLIPAKGSGKENRPACNSSTMALQYTKMFQPGAGSPSKISALPKPRRSMLPALRKSHLPSLAKHAVVVDGRSSDGTPMADHAVVTDPYRFRFALQKSRLPTVHPGGLRPGRDSRRLPRVLPSLHSDLL